MPTSSTVRLGLIGAGRMGSFHAHTAARHIPGASLTAIADPCLARPRAWPKPWAFARCSPTPSSYSIAPTSTR